MTGVEKKMAKDPLENLTETTIREIINPLKQQKYILADTRIESVSLCDHLVLTAGISVSIVVELLQRGFEPKRICGENISEEELIDVARISGLLHDWGKVVDYRGHVDRGVEYVRGWLNKQDVKKPFSELITFCVQRHQLKPCSPETLLEKTVCLADSIASAGDRPELSRYKEFTKNLDTLLNVSENTLALESDLFGTQKGLVLILGDVDKVKSYVFETTRLPEIRGASEILNELNLEKVEEVFSRQGLSPETLIYAGGGSFLAIVPASIAKDLVNATEAMYLQETEIASISCVATKPLGYLDFARGLSPYDDESVDKLSGQGAGEWLLKSHFRLEDEKRRERKCFAELVSRLSAELRQKKDSKINVPFFTALPIARRCVSCGMRSATREDRLTDPETGAVTVEYICNICDSKRKNGGKSRFVKEFTKYVKEKYGINIEAEKAKKLVQRDLDSLASPDNYVAFIYVDGNDIGGILERAKTPAAFRHISENLCSGTENAVYEALYTTFKKDLSSAKFENIKFEIINIGGDDVTLIVQAKDGWKVATDILNYFEQNLASLAKELNVEKITASAGMVVAKATYPIYFAEKLADGLLKMAKKKAKTTRESALNYLYLTTTIATIDAGDLVEQLYHRNSQQKHRLTMRPYTLRQAMHLFKLAEETSEIFQSSQRNALAQALDIGVFSSINFLAYQMGRMKKNDQDKANELFRKIGVIFGCNWFRIWGTDDEQMTATPLYDILEIAKFSKLRGA